MKYYIWLIGKIIKTAPVYIGILFLLNAFFALLQPVELILTQNITRKLVNYENILNIIVWLLLYIVIMDVKGIKTSIIGAVSELFNIKIHEFFYSQMFCKLNKINLLDFDDAELYLRIKRAKKAIENMVCNSLNNILYVIANLISIVSIGVFIINIHYKYLLVFIVLIFIQNIYSLKIADDNISLAKFQDVKGRRHDYFLQLLCNKDNLKEIRAYKINDWINKKRIHEFKEMEQRHFKIVKKWTIINAIWTIVMYGCELFIWLLLFFDLSKGQIGIDQVIVIIQSHASFFSIFASVISILSSSYQDMAYIKDLYMVVNYSETDVEDSFNIIEKNEKDVLIMKNVSFSYRNRKHVLNNINIKINRGEIITLVGDNGSGKSTLAKIMAQLITPDEGKLVLGIKESSAVFQDFVCFNMNIETNVYLGNTYNTINKYEIQKLLELMEVKYSMDTNLGKEFYDNGIDISLGEWQKLAICRALYKDSDFIIFDEPSASLDAMAEKKQFDIIKKVLQKKTVVLISHRIGLAKLADRVFFIKGGRIVESGTHKELMELKGNYYNYYNSQAKWYK